MSQLSAFNYIPERSEGTPGLWNAPLSILSANIAALNSDLTLNFPSGNTLSLFTGLEVSGGIHAQYVSVGSTPASEITTAGIVIGVNSAFSDYLHLTDSSGARSSYVIGSRAGGTADGLNIWDASGDTMIVSFSKQSVRFYQNVVGPVFDVGGALADTLNAATFGTGADSTESRIQAAIDAAAGGGISRVYVPANMYPYSASSISFIYSVRMVREGGDWSRYDAFAYGAVGDGTADDTDELKALAAASGASGGIAFIPAGTYSVRSTVYWRQNTMVLGDGRGVTVISRRSTSVTQAHPNNTCAIFRTGPSDNTDYLPGSHGNYIAFQDFTIDGNADVISSRTSITNTNLGIDGLRAHHVDYLQTNRVEIRNCLETGMYIWGCQRSTHFGSVFRRNGLIGVASARNGIALTGPQDDATNRGAQDEHLFFGCSSVSNQDEGMSAGRVGQVVLVGGIYRDNGDAGIEGDSGTATTDTSDVPAGWTITGAYVYRNGSHGINIGNTNVQRVAISNNVVEENVGHGIALTFNSGALASVVGNVLTSNGTTSQSQHGILVTAGFEKVVIANNLIDGASISSGAGIVVTAQGGGRYVEIVGNLVTDYGVNGLSIAGQATGIIANNSVISTTATASDAFLITASTGIVDNLLIVGNLAMNSKNNGFHVRSTGTLNLSNVRLFNNVATDNQAVKTQLYGLSLATLSSGSLQALQLMGNDFSGNASGTINGFQQQMMSIGPLDSLSSISYSGFQDFTRAWASFSTALHKAGAALAPGMAFSSESSLGWFRSGSSTMELSYGTLAASKFSAIGAAPGAVDFTTRNGNVISHNVAGGTYNLDLGTVFVRNGNHNGTVAGALFVGDGSLTTVGFGWNSDLSLGFYRSGASTIAQSFGTLNLATNSVRLSMRTVASFNSTTMSVNEVVFAVGGASGVSLGIRSGGTIYYFESSVSTKG
jgi:pectate lyase-like protein